MQCCVADIFGVEKLEILIKLSDKGEKGDITRHLQGILESCREKDEEKIIRFEKGEYHFYSDFCPEEEIYASNTDSDKYPLKKSAVRMNSIKNLTLDGGGSLFLMHGKMIALYASYCENITLKNFIWDFPCADTLEMEIIGKGLFYTDYRLPEKAQWEIREGKLHWYEKSPFDGKKYWHNIGQQESYCTLVSDGKSGNLSRYGVTDGPFAFSVGMKGLGESKLRIYSLKPTVKFSVGDTFEICTDKKRDCVGALFLESKNAVAENIGVRYMHGFGWLSQMCENISFKNCDFIPEEKSDRKCTSFADLVHISGAKGKVLIDSCRFSNAHDDPINIHGTYTVVKKRIDDNTLMLYYAHKQQNGFRQYHKGDKVVFYLRDNLQGFEGGREFTVKSVVSPLQEDCGIKEMKVSFEEKIPDEIAVKDKYAVENITYTPDVTIRNCCFSSIPTRGILCTTRGKVVIEGNSFDGMTMASIYISDDCNNWFESGRCENVLIRDNKFLVKKPPAFKGNKPAILIEPIVKTNTGKAVHRNITIENNEFHLWHSNALDAILTENLTFRRNRVINCSKDKGPLKAIKIKGCKNVVIEDNDFGKGIDV